MGIKTYHYLQIIPDMIQIDIPHLLDDNTLSYLEWLIGIVEYADPGSEIIVRKNGDIYQVTIKPNNSEFRQSTIENVLYLHHRLKVPIKYSKSLAISKLISYDIS